ncbi:MAG: hypothetical protein CVU41_12515 [Chloroflexi bacterium HGW-Chloroflexi-3]|nr:MAG: hypothetical protein CVU41_12515 [Chloroflexi bacterium HGW-Chloroflexi-3]
MKRKFLLFFFFSIFLIFFSGCSLSSFGQTGFSPAELTATYEVMIIDAMKTAIGEITQQALLNPSATNTFTAIPPTNTPIPSATPITPTPTFTAVPPTETPLPPTSTTTPTVTPTRSDFNCQLVSNSPALNQSYPPGGDFDGRWTFKNTGSEVWDKDKVDFLFFSGTRFQEHVDKLDLNSNVSNGESIEFIIDMLAPKSAGTYSATWGLKKDDIVFCSAMIQIVVK